MGFIIEMSWKVFSYRNVLERVSYRNVLEWVLLWKCIGKSFTIEMYLKGFYRRNALKTVLL